LVNVCGIEMRRSGSLHIEFRNKQTKTDKVGGR